MEIAFTKMHGAGNDFVMIENLDGRIELSPEQVRRLCDRRFGIGADGLILLSPSKAPDAEAAMVYYNADGGRVDMCGNGARCFTAFALQNGLGKDAQLSFTTDAGPMTASFAEDQYTIRMTPVRDLRRDQTLIVAPGLDFRYDFLNTGVEHVVVFVEDVSEVDIRGDGSAVRYHPDFAPRGTNANFAQLLPDGVIQVRTYERGVEDETLACGTGVAAVAVAAVLRGMATQPVALRVAGGDVLRVDFRRDGEAISDVTLTGPAKVVFTGVVELEGA